MRNYNDITNTFMFQVKALATRGSHQITPDEKKIEILAVLKEFVEEEDALYATYEALESCIDQEEFCSVIAEHVAGKKAKTVSQHLYKMMDKDKVTYDTVQHLYNQLKRAKMSLDAIEDVKIMISQGKKEELLRLMTEQIGKNNGMNLYMKYENVICRQKNMPMEGAVKIKEANGLEFYEYPQDLIYKLRKNEAKTVIIFGQTGSGKSTFLNAVVNYLAMVSLHDHFRYQIVVENHQSQKYSATKQVKIYYAEDLRTKHLYKLIDTPGFGDTEGIEKDRENQERLKQLLTKEVREVHCILFVLKSSTNRITEFQRYIFKSVMALFGKDIAQNFGFVLTFSDPQKPQVLQVIQDKQIGFGQYWSQLKHPKYISVNNCGIFTKVNKQSTQDQAKQVFWRIAMESIEKILQKVQRLKGNSLTMTREMIKTKDQLALQLRRARDLLQQSVTKQSALQQYIDTLARYSFELDANKQFQIQRPTAQYYTQKTNKNIMRCITCSNTNCHYNCEIQKGQHKNKCQIFDSNGNCTVCIRRCSSLNHFTTNQERKCRIVKIKQTNWTLRDRYMTAKTQKSLAETAIMKVAGQLNESVYLTVKYANEIMKIQQKLDQICLTNRKQESLISYLKYLITEEKRYKKHGWQKRIEAYNDSISEYEIIESYTKGEIRQNLKMMKQSSVILVDQSQEENEGESKKEGEKKINLEMLDEIRFQRNQRLIQRVKPEFWMKIRDSLKRQ